MWLSANPWNRGYGKYNVLKILKEGLKRVKDILFINMPSAFTAYKGTKLNAGMQVYPLLSYTSLGAVLKGKGFDVNVLDLGIEDKPYEEIGRASCRERV